MRHRHSILAAVSSLALLLAVDAAWAQDATQLLPGQSINAELRAGDRTAGNDSLHRDFWIELAANQRVEITLRSEDFDSFVQVLDADSLEAITSNDDGFDEGLDSRLRFTAPKGGRYVVRAQALGGDETGAFELSLTELPPAPPAPEPRRIRVGESISGVLDLEDPIEGEERPYEAYAFDAQAGDRFTIRMTSATIDSYVQVGRQTDTGFEELANNDDDPTGDTLDSRLVFTAPEAGPFVIRAMPLSAGSEGPFDLTLEQGPVPVPSVPLVLGGAESDGDLTEQDAKNAADQTIDTYSFVASAGQRIEVTAGSEDFDTYIAVFDASENLIGEDDDGGTQGTNSRLVFVAPETGAYRVEVRAFSEGTFGNYSVAAKEIAPPPPPTPLTYGATIEPEITEDDPVDDDGRHFDAYSFRGVANQRVQVTMRSGDFDSFVQIGKAGDAFEALASDDDGLREGVDSRLNFTLPEDGEYVIRAMPLGSDGKGLYSLELIDKGPKPNPGSLLIGATARGRLTEADSMDEGGTLYDDWTFQAKEGDELELIMVSNELDSMLSVGRLSDDGSFRSLASDDDGLVDVHARLEWTVPEDGTYVVRAQSFAPNQSGNYALIVSRKD